MGGVNYLEVLEMFKYIFRFRKVFTVKLSRKCKWFFIKEDNGNIRVIKYLWQGPAGWVKDYEDVKNLVDTAKFYVYVLSIMEDTKD